MPVRERDILGLRNSNHRATHDPPWVLRRRAPGGDMACYPELLAESTCVYQHAVPAAASVAADLPLISGCRPG